MQYVTCSLYNEHTILVRILERLSTDLYIYPMTNYTKQSNATTFYVAFPESGTQNRNKGGLVSTIKRVTLIIFCLCSTQLRCLLIDILMETPGIDDLTDMVKWIINRYIGYNKT